MKKIIESKIFKNFTISLIIVNFFVLWVSTTGVNTSLVENCILFYFAVEVGLKIKVYGWNLFKKDNWNKFDLTIVIVGILPLLGAPLPHGSSGLRALRLLRIISVIPAFRNIMGAIGKSMSKMMAVAGLTLILFAICTLMATLSFQKELPEEFGNMLASFGTLLQMAVFSKPELVGIAWSLSPFSTLLVFPLFYLGVPFMTLNLVIGVLGNALSEESGKDDEIKKIKEEMKKLNEKLDRALTLLKKK